MTTHLQYASIDDPAPLTHTWNTTFPRHVQEALDRAPATTRGIPGHYVYRCSDIPSIWPIAEYGKAELFDAPLMMLLVNGADLAADFVECGDDLHDDLFDWVDNHTYPEVAAWYALMEAEVRMHQAQIIVGNAPRPHSAASEAALWLIVDCAGTYLDTLYGEEEEPMRDEFEAAGGTEDYHNTLTLVADLTCRKTEHEAFFTNPGWRKQTRSMLHPSNWFRSYLPETNPWLEQQ